MLSSDQMGWRGETTDLSRLGGPSMDVHLDTDGKPIDPPIEGFHWSNAFDDKLRATIAAEAKMAREVLDSPTIGTLVDLSYIRLPETRWHQVRNH